MRIPKKLKIGGHVIKVDTSKVLKDVNGDSDFAKNLIRISNDLPKSQKESTLIHEIFHFLNTTISDSHVGHSFLDSISEQFYQVLSDNKLLK